MWGRTVRRLFPAALTVPAVVIIASVTLLPEAIESAPRGNEDEDEPPA
ncbi:hypothetical protein GCM10009754_59250 [Amycolatopsis minnesotensis]|uniref:Uncharacterized protein n=1 Tax=Amycolatopsis minnesotensis TaxID=337894 RepID=A0ABN2RW04_9PSEU